MQCIIVPTGMLFKGRVLPVFIGALFPDEIASPSLSPFGAIIYLLSPSLYKTRAICEERLGSYSILSTTADILSLFLLKSISL